MVQLTEGESPKLPVDQLARFLLECAKVDPALLARSNPEPLMPVEPLARSDLGTLDELLALRPGASGIRGEPEMEELVSIAVACARRAEDALQHAHEVSRMARRRMSMVAALTGAGLAAGVTALVLDRNRAVADPRLTEVASAMRSVGDMQRDTVARLAEVRSNVEAMRDSAPQVLAAQTPEAAAPAAKADNAKADDTPFTTARDETRASDMAAAQPQLPPLPPPQPRNNQPRAHVYNAHYAAHSYRRPAWRSQPNVVAQVFADVRRNFAAIFH